MAKLSNKGFAVVGIIIGVLVVGLVGAGVYYTYQSQNDNDQDTASVPTSTETSQPATQEPKPPEETSSWLEYKGGSYSIRFADGWKLNKRGAEGQYKDSFSTIINSDLKLRPGQKAAIVPYVEPLEEDNRHELYFFTIDYHPKGPQLGKKCSEEDQFKGKLAFKTASNGEVYKRTYTGTATTRDFGDLVKGEKSYLYCVQLKGSAQLSVAYVLKTTMEDHSATIERVLKTVITL